VNAAGEQERQKVKKMKGTKIDTADDNFTYAGTPPLNI